MFGDEPISYHAWNVEIYHLDKRIEAGRAKSTRIVEQGPLRLARFEVCAHRWADLSEPGFGLALLNDCKYGHSTHGGTMRLSLLRSPKMPSAEADMGRHQFRYALLPHPGSLQEAGVVHEARRFNSPLILGRTDAEPADTSWFSVDSPGIVIDTVKKAEDSDAIIARMYEAHGSHAKACLRSSLPVRSVARCNLLEEDETSLEWRDGAVHFELGPFQILTLKLGVMRKA